MGIKKVGKFLSITFQLPVVCKTAKTPVASIDVFAYLAILNAGKYTRNNLVPGGMSDEHSNSHQSFFRSGTLALMICSYFVSAFLLF